MSNVEEVAVKTAGDFTGKLQQSLFVCFFSLPLTNGSIEIKIILSVFSPETRVLISLV